MTKLFELSQEYMLNGVEQMIRQELINKTTLLMLTNDMEYAVPLFILAEKMRCKEAIDIGLRVIPENFQKNGRALRNSNSWKILVNNDNLRDNLKTKMIALTLKNKINNLNQFEHFEKSDLETIANELIKISDKGIEN